MRRGTASEGGRCDRSNRTCHFNERWRAVNEKIRLVNGKIVSDVSACKMARGAAKRARFDTLQEFGNLLGRLDEQSAVAFGALQPALSDEVAVVKKQTPSDER
jgi:hypothetical protein